MLLAYTRLVPVLRLPMEYNMTWAGTLGPTDLVVDTAGQETLMSAQDHS